jgi:hypothetical protein
MKEFDEDDIVLAARPVSSASQVTLTAEDVIETAQKEEKSETQEGI